MSSEVRARAVVAQSMGKRLSVTGGKTTHTHKALEGPYDWNHYPMAPPGTKAIIYKDSDTRASWAPHGLDAWLLGPSKDHYRCHLYYVPESRGYRVSGSADLFPQHCLAPSYLPISHVRELSEELKTNLATFNWSAGTKQVTKDLEIHLRAFILNKPLPEIVPKTKGDCD